MAACPEPSPLPKLHAVPATSSLLTDDPLWIVAPTYWREACFSLPATRALAKTRAIHLLCPESQRELWETAGIEEIQTYDPASSPRALAKALPNIQQCLLWEDGVGARAMASAKVSSRVGLPAEGLAKSLTTPIDITQRPGPSVHHVRRYLDSATQLGAGPFEPQHFAPLPSPVERQRDTLLISPDSEFGSHFNWPAERWIQLLELLPIRKELTHVHDSGEIAREIAHAMDLTLTEAATPQQLPAFEYCLSVDSFVPHLAAAYGVTCAVLFGPGDPELTRPLGKQHLSIRNKAECSPCFAEHCPLDLRCQLELEVDQVHQALAGFMGA